MTPEEQMKFAEERMELARDLLKRFDERRGLER